MPAATTPIRRADLVESIAAALQYISYYHPPDYIAHLARAYEREQSPAAKDAIAQILTNSRMSAEGHRPLCQDTGIVNVFLKVGRDVRWEGFNGAGSREDAINEGVRQGYLNPDNVLRASVVDPPEFGRKNTKDNTPAVIHTNAKNGIYTLTIPTTELKLFEGNKEELIKALNGDKAINPEKFPFILDDGGYLYIFVSSLKELMNIKPDFGKLMELSSARKGFDAFTLFTTETFEKNNHAHLRFFTPFYGIDEDPVTGSANGPLLLVLSKLRFIKEDTEGKTFTFEQGDVLGRKGRINVAYSPSKNELSIAGKAVTIFKGEIFF